MQHRARKLQLSTTQRTANRTLPVYTNAQYTPDHRSVFLVGDDYGEEYSYLRKARDSLGR